MLTGLFGEYESSFVRNPFVFYGALSRYSRNGVGVCSKSEIELNFFFISKIYLLHNEILGELVSNSKKVKYVG